MTIPDHIPEDMNWADYFDALINQRFSWPAIERRRSQTSERVPERRAKRHGSERKKGPAQAA
jgi:hypothetical protein